MDADPPFFLQLYAFGTTVIGHVVTLLFGFVFAAVSIVALVRKNTAVGKLLGILAAIALLVACFQAFNDEHKARLVADKARNAAEGERNEARQTAGALQKALDVAKAQIAALRADGSREHPFSSADQCPHGATIYYGNTARDIGPGGTAYRSGGPACFVENTAERIAPGGVGFEALPSKK